MTLTHPNCTTTKEAQQQHQANEGMIQKMILEVQKPKAQVTQWKERIAIKEKENST